jgi:uncharacterized membrane protein
MDAEQIILACINVVGGVLVIGSYVREIRAHPRTRNDAWGGVPRRLIRPYVVSMLLAAAGFFLFTYFILFRLEPSEARIADTFDFSLFYVIYALILFPSALWMPLTFSMLERPRRSMWWAIRLTLAVVGLASVWLLVSLLLTSPKEPTWAFGLAVAGSAAFCVQTALLDAIVWPAYFPLKR